MAKNPLNRELGHQTPNVVPASYTPVPEQFAAPLTQNQRAMQSREAQGYALKQISYLENQLHKAAYKRDNPNQTDDELIRMIGVAKTAKTIMVENLSRWAGSMTEEEMEYQLPATWSFYVQQVESPETDPIEASAAEEIPVDMPLDDTPAEGDVEPIDVLGRPEIPEDAPVSEVEAPDQLELGDILAKIAEDND